MRAPILAAWLVAACTAVAFAAGVYAIPIAVNDQLEVIVRAAGIPSFGAAFEDGVENSATQLRPLRLGRTWLLVRLGAMLGDGYHAAFRGYHALLAVLLVGLFAHLARVHSWTGVAALAFGLAVLAGMTTFAGLLYEAYPVNHFLIVAIYGLAVAAIAGSRGGWWADIAVACALAVALLTLESGVLLVLIAGAAYAGGQRGLSRRGLYGIAAIMIGYVLFRSYEDVQLEQFGDRTSGFGAGLLTSEERLERFGDNPTPLYLYNVVMSVLALLLSQPQEGQWTIVNAWNRGDVAPLLWVRLVASAGTTAVIAWYVLGSERLRRTRWREPLPLMFVGVSSGSAVLSFLHPKPEIMSLAGVFYALLSVAAMRALLESMSSRLPALALSVVLALLSSAWAIQAVGLQFRMRQAVVDTRGAWATVLSPAERDRWPRDLQTLTLTSRLKEEALMWGGAAVTVLPQAQQRWLTED